MKKKSDGMSPDMFHDATSSTPILVFTTTNDGTKNETQNPLQDVTEDLTGVPFGTPVKSQNETDNFTGVPNGTPVKLQNETEDFTGVPNGTPVTLQAEIIKVNFDKQTVSARVLYAFFELGERFSKWWRRMVLYGLEKNVDFTTVPFGTVVNQGGIKEIGDYLLTIEAAKHVAMVQRSAKGKQARQYFINIEKLYLKTISNKQTDVKSTSLLETLDGIAAQIDNLRNSIALLENEMIQNQQVKKENDRLVEKIIVLERQSVQQENFSNLKDEYLERTISKKIDIALKASFRETEQLRNGHEVVNLLPSATNPNKVVTLNQLEKTIQKTTLEEDFVRKYYRPAERKTENALFLTATEITHHLEFFSKRVTVRNVGIALKKLGFERLHSSVNGVQTKGYFVVRVY
jgi:anti-repressor protein